MATLYSRLILSDCRLLPALGVFVFVLPQVILKQHIRSFKLTDDLAQEARFPKGQIYAH